MSRGKSTGSYGNHLLIQGKNFGVLFIVLDYLYSELSSEIEIYFTNVGVDFPTYYDPLIYVYSPGCYRLMSSFFDDNEDFVFFLKPKIPI